MVSPIKRLKPGEMLSVATAQNGSRSIEIVAIITGEDGYKRVLIDLGSATDTFELLNEIGNAPLPPYIHRPYADETAQLPTRMFDLQRYQTVYASAPGAVAAPTAGLHFSDELLSQLRDSGIEIAELTLHVGPGTFKPIESNIEDHFVEPEVFFISERTAAAINRAKAEGRRVIAVGTTTLRALETAGAVGQINAVNGERTSLYVKPGHQFNMVNGLITNFHLSRSSLLVLVATFAGREFVLRAYKEAIAERYRFYSYGDAMLVL